MLHLYLSQESCPSSCALGPNKQSRSAASWVGSIPEAWLLSSEDSANSCTARQTHRTAVLHANMAHTGEGT